MLPQSGDSGGFKTIIPHSQAMPGLILYDFRLLSCLKTRLTLLLPLWIQAGLKKPIPAMRAAPYGILPFFAGVEGAWPQIIFSKAIKFLLRRQPSLMAASLEEKKMFSPV
jgi:hypothetical protein